MTASDTDANRLAADHQTAALRAARRHCRRLALPPADIDDIANTGLYDAIRTWNAELMPFARWLEWKVDYAARTHADAFYSRRTHETPIERIDVAARGDPDLVDLHVAANLLPPEQRRVLADLLDGHTRTDIARRHSLDTAHVTRMIDGIAVGLGLTPGPAPPTTRQREILTLAAQGMTASVIAARLYVSVNTVKNHLAAAYRRLGVHNAPAAVAVCKDRAWI